MDRRAYDQKYNHLRAKTKEWSDRYVAYWTDIDRCTEELVRLRAELKILQARIRLIRAKEVKRLVRLDMLDLVKRIELVEKRRKRLYNQTR